MTRRRGGRGTKTSRPGAGSRDLKVRVKTARRRKVSSTRWLERQLNDPYVAEAKRRNFRSRAAFKLIEIDDRFGLLKRGSKVIDLGCAPGGWCQVAAERTHSAAAAGRVVGIDLKHVDPIPGVTLIELDFTDPDAERRILEEFDDGKVDAVLSDMAAPATGHKHTDHLKIMALCEAAADFAMQVLSPDGSFCAKVLRGGTENDLLVTLKTNFEHVRHFKPEASRSDSAETYVIATGFRGPVGNVNTTDIEA